MRLSRITVLFSLLLVCSAALGQTRPDRPTSPDSSGGSSRSDRAPLFSNPDTERKALRTIDEVIQKINSHSTVEGRDESKSYKILFDAYLKLSSPPMAIGSEFNQNTIHNKMEIPRWSAVSGWAESNSAMAQAIIDARDKNIVGLPYGKDEVDASYRQAGLYIDLVRDGQLGRIEFEYFNALRTISAFATAEVYRRMEVGQVEEALELAMAHIFVLRQFCDRDFLEEKFNNIEMLSSALRNLRDVFYVYRNKISTDQFRDIALRQIPFLRPDRSRLFMPEADRIVSEARIRFVFDEASGRADPDIFASTFAVIQSRNEPLIRFGAAKRWKIVAEVHGSLPASIERLQLIYDDWWRRWRIEEYDSILEIETEYDRCNPVRYAAVLFSMANIEALFSIRNHLIAEVNGTAMAAGLCGYYRTYEKYPRESRMVYSVSVRKRSDSDPHEFDLAPFKYRLTTKREAIDTPSGRIWIEPGSSLLYSRGQDHTDDRAANHTDDGTLGDVVIWPPVKAVLREQGLID